MGSAAAPARRLTWEGCLNARDLGGYLTRDGRETRWRAIVRSDDPSPLTEAGRAALIEYGVRSIGDLRMPEEVRAYPNPFAQAGDHGVAYTNVSLIDPAAERPEFTSLAADYIGMLDRFRPTVATAVTAIARAPAGGVLVHCMGGKDRTGLVSAILLELAGVERATIGADYALTAECLRPREEEWLANGPGDRAERERLLALYAPRAEVMLEVLDHLDRRYGGVQPYLLGAGATPQDIAGLRGRFVGE